MELNLVEDERHAEYLLRNYTWPLTSVSPNTDGWKRLMFRRLAQVERIKNTADRYNAFYTTMSSAITCPNFTESGWGLTRAPLDLVQELQESLHAGLAANDSTTIAPLKQEEPLEPSIVTNVRPVMVPQVRLNSKILHALLPLHEQWAGVPLVPTQAYGLRVYHNTSRLLMHVDRLDTHVISGILHVGHSDDSEPWPLVLEDFQGNTNEIVLQVGDLLLYESSKCWHGRPRQFRGSWYSSLFLHYRPATRTLRAGETTATTMVMRGESKNVQNAILEAHYAVPPHWTRAQPPDARLEALEMVGTSFREPSCPHEWCACVDAVQWQGPGIEGKVISTMSTTSLLESGEEPPDSVVMTDEL